MGSSGWSRTSASSCAARGHEVSVATLRQPGREAEPSRGRRRGPRAGQLHLPAAGRSGSTTSAATRRPLPTPRPCSTCAGCCGASGPTSSTPTTGSCTPTCRSTAAAARPWRSRCTTTAWSARPSASSTTAPPAAGPGRGKCVRCAADYYSPAKGAGVALRHPRLGAAGAPPRRRLPAGQRGGARALRPRRVRSLPGRPQPHPRAAGSRCRPAIRTWPACRASRSSSTSATSPIDKGGAVLAEAYRSLREPAAAGPGRSLLPRGGGEPAGRRGARADAAPLRDRGAAALAVHGRALDPARDLRAGGAGDGGGGQADRRLRHRRAQRRRRRRRDRAARAGRRSGGAAPRRSSGCSATPSCASGSARPPGPRRRVRPDGGRAPVRAGLRGRAGGPAGRTRAAG